MMFDADVDWAEAFAYRPGLIVELKAEPGTFDTIADYDPSMVPPVWLVNHPRPHYPHQLRVVSHDAAPSSVQALLDIIPQR